MVQGNGALTVMTPIEPLGELTISTNGRGEVVTGSVMVLGDFGGVLRFDFPGVGVAGVGASAPVRDAIFPARRMKQGIDTGIALRNPGTEAMEVRCQLMREGETFETVPIPLAANGQKAQFLTEMFSFIEAADVEGSGSVKCTAPFGRTFTGVALEMDTGNRIFTTLPLVPLTSYFSRGGRLIPLRVQARDRLDFAHFANGDSAVSDLVLMNVSTAHYAIHPVIYFLDQKGDVITADSVVEITGDLAVREDGGLIPLMAIDPQGELTISTTGKGELRTGSVTVISPRPIGGVLRFDIPGVGVAGVGASTPVSDAIFPARRTKQGINTGIALRNLGAEAVGVTCRLMKRGTVLEEREVPLEANGQEARFIDQLFTDADTSDLVGSVRCSVPEGMMFTGVALEMDVNNRIFTTLPMIPVSR